MTERPAPTQVVRSARAALPVALALLCLLAGTVPARAATYYVSPGGSDTNAGTVGAPWRTIAKANATLAAGDVCWISPGTYGDAIQPASSGTSSARIHYLGNQANPAAVVVPGITLSRAWVTVQGVKATSSFMLTYSSESAKAWHDSVAYCHVPEITLWGAQDCMVARCVVSGQVTLAYDKGYASPSIDPAVATSMRDTLSGNVCTTVITYKGFSLRAVRNCVFEGNTFNFNFEVARGSDLQGRYLYNSFSNTFRGNRWNLEADGALTNVDEYTGFALRDSSSYNLFERDTMYCGLQSGYDIGGRLCNAGNTSWVGQCVGNVWRRCVYRTTGYTWSQDVLNGATLENSVFASKNSWGLYLLGGVKNTTIRNCTIASWAAPAMKVEGDIRLGGNTISSNIFFSDSVAACYSNRPVLQHTYTTGFSENDNLFYARAAAPGVTASTQAVYWAATACSGVGAGTGWATSSGADTRSKFAAPLFASDRWATFDAHLRAGSPAIGMAAGGGDAGAYPFDVGGGDPAPSAVTNLAVAQRSNKYALLTWTSPADAAGTVIAYDLRLSTQPIDATSFAAATAVTVAPTVLPAGSAQSYALTGLTASTTYYFAIKSQDSGGTWSAISNVASATTTATDQVLPGQVQDLH